MRNKILHIGLGKCGSTFLQKDIFPLIEKNTNIKLIQAHDIKDIKLNSYEHILKNITGLEKKLPHNFIFSNEGLFSNGWEFSRVVESFELVKKNFSHDTKILIVIRNPYDLLNSIYVQTIMRMDIIESEKFFYIEKNKIFLKDGKYNLYNFEYNFLINLYKSYFKKVVVVKYENLNKLLFLQEFFKLENNFLRFLQTKEKKIFNPSISKLGIESFIFLNKFLNLKKTQLKINNFLKKPSNEFFYKVKWKLFSFLQLKEFFQYKIDVKFKTKKYYIDKNKIPLDIDKLISEYEQLK